jgi:ASC-1-like (ASCH) protein
MVGTGSMSASGSHGLTEVCIAEEDDMATRHLKTRPEWEDALRSGLKTIDARLVADDIAGLEVGDILQYPGAEVRVRHVRFYPGFGDLLAYEDWSRIAPEASSREEVRRRLEEGHEATVRATGAVAIEVERIDHRK